MVKKSTKLSTKNYFVIVIFGMLGQVAWCIENNYLNVFMDRTITTSSFAIAFMVGASAIVATATTLIMGVMSDKYGKRSKFMVYGYIIWGFTIMAFCLITVDNMMKAFSLQRDTAITLSVVMVIILDCVMTFFGATANDAAFNAWVTDVTDDTNRGFIDAVLGIMAVLATALVFGIFDGMTQNKYYDSFGNKVINRTEAEVVVYGNWPKFFIILGALVILGGIIGIFIVRDKKDLAPNKEYNVKTIFYGFRPSVIKDNKNLYLVLSCLAILGIANMSFFPYLLIYIERTLGVEHYIIPFGIIFGMAAIASVFLGIIMDKSKNKLNYVIPGIGVYIIGAVAMYFVSPVFFTKTPIALLCFVAFIQSIGNYMVSISCNATVRSLTPQDKVGLFQGVRMVFFVLIPMCVGPLITAILNTTNKNNIIGFDSVGQPIFIYSPTMFLIAAFIVVLTLIPAIFLMKNIKKEQNVNMQS